MKRLLVALSLAVLVSLALGGAAAYAASGSDYARGNVDQGANFPSTDWRFRATSNFNGTQPSGTIRVTFANEDPNTVVTADVTCLRVVNGEFQARGVVTDVRGGPTFGIGNSVIIHGSDAGKFSTTPDTFQGGFSSLTDPGPCGGPIPGSPVQDGEIVVHDS
jgi:hypothetical protein